MMCQSPFPSLLTENTLDGYLINQWKLLAEIRNNIKYYYYSINKPSIVIHAPPSFFIIFFVVEVIHIPFSPFSLDLDFP